MPIQAKKDAQATAGFRRKGKRTEHGASLKLPLLFICYLTIPQFIFVYFGESSVGAGLACISGVLGLIYLPFGRIYFTKCQIAALTIIVLSIAASNLTLEFALLPRQISSLFLMMMIFVVTNDFFGELAAAGNKRLKVVFKVAFYALLLIGILGKLYPVKLGNYSNTEKSIFPFSEQSHFALAFGPIACAYMMQLRKTRQVFVPVAMLGLAFWYPNATMLVSSLFVLIVILSGRVILGAALIVVCGLLLPAGVKSKIDVGYFLDRIESTGGSGQLSKLVYQQGWDQARIANMASHGLGVGFQAFGTEPAGDYVNRIADVYHLELNRQDGSDLGAKLVGELGIAGMVALVAAIIIAIKSLRVLRSLRGVSDECGNYAYIMFRVITYMVLIELLFRGLGYLEPMAFLYIFSLDRIGIKFGCRRETGLLWIHRLGRS